MSPVDKGPQAFEGDYMRKVRKAVFPVAGLGTRFLPATKAMPRSPKPNWSQNMRRAIPLLSTPAY